MHTSPRRPPPLLIPALLLAACGGGGGGGTPPARLSGTLDVPTIAPARLQQLADAERPMVPGEVVVWLADPTAPPPDLGAQGLDLLRATGGPIAVYRPRAALRLRTRAEGASTEDSMELATCEAAAAADEAPGVRCANPNWLYQPLVIPNDTHFGKQWHYPLINLPQAWDVTQGSSSVIVAVIDTGIASGHPEFAGRLIAGFDMISDPSVSVDGDGRDADPEDPGDGIGTGQPSSFHGTHVAGTIGANGNDGQGVAGVDWNCKLMPIRALGRGGGTTADIVDAILFAARLANGSGQLPAQRADIVNMSLGVPGLNPVLEQACDAAANAGVLLVAAAGNDNTGNPGSPAAFASVLSVGAVDMLRQRAPYSNFHTSIDVWAPGGDMLVDRNGDTFADGVLSCMKDDQGQFFFSFEQGTSMASPHVAGVAALVKAAAPGLTAAQIRNILLSTATTVQGLPNAGVMVDALAAVQAAGSPPTTPILVATPTAIDFGSSGTQATVTLQNRGTGTLTFVSANLDPAAPWFSGTLLPASGGGISDDVLEVTADRTGLPAGVQQTRLTLVFTDGSQQFTTAVDFRLQVGGDPTSSDTVFVLLVDAASFQTRAQVETTAQAGFQYAFPSIAPGTYLLVAGTDRDNDNDISDEGELFGAFPNLDTPIALVVSAGADASGFDFALQEQIVISGARPAGRPAYRRLR